MKKVLGIYRGTASYHDSGVVTLEIRDPDRVPAEDRVRLPDDFLRTGKTTAPLSLWFHRGDFYLEAYALRMINDQTQRITWIVDPSTNDHDGQVLIGTPLNRRPSLDRLFSDPIALAHVQIGLAGPPPQLDWLLADEPMRNVFLPENTLDFDGYSVIRGTRCRCIKVVSQGDVYQFWVSMKSGVFLRVVFPDVISPIVHGGKPIRMQLTLDLDNASFETPEQTPRRSPVPSNAKLVKQFVPLPPPTPPGFLGRTVRSKSFTSVSGDLTIQDGRSDRPITVVANLNGAETPVDLAVAIAQWEIALSPKQNQGVRVLMLANKQLSRKLPREISTSRITVDNSRDVLQHESRAGVYVLDQFGRVVWYEPDSSMSLLSTISQVLTDLERGVDVVDRVAHQANEAYRVYIAEVGRNKAD